jgi:hypothetical protein
LELEVLRLKVQGDLADLGSLLGRDPLARDDRGLELLLGIVIFETGYRAVHGLFSWASQAWLIPFR